MKKLSMKQQYHVMTRDLDWDPTYVERNQIYPYLEFEGIKVHDWEAWEDPFRLTMASYYKYQAEKDRRLYAVLESFEQNQSHLRLSDGRYINNMKVFLSGLTPVEYAAHRQFAFLARHLGGPAPRFSALLQSIDELRHAQTQLHTFNLYNKYYDGFDNFRHLFDRIWYLAVTKSYIEDAMTAGPFESLIALSFSLEYMLTNLLFVPYMSGANFNGDAATTTMGFSSQSDESRHMTLGLEVIKFLLEQDEANVPIVQEWVDKWFWRGYRVMALVSVLMDYMLPTPFMSWKESFELYFEQQMLDGLFPDLEYYGLTRPRHVDIAIAEKDHYSSNVYWALYQWNYVTAFHTWTPSDEHLDWLSAKYPDTFDRYHRPKWEKAKRIAEGGGRYYNPSVAPQCQVCVIPPVFTEPGDPTRLSVRISEYKGDRYVLCSDGCQWIFEREPEKYIQAPMPTNQLYRGNLGGPTIPEVVAWFGIDEGVQNHDYLMSGDARSWEEWHATGSLIGGK